jgi:hypothetical protein
MRERGEGKGYANAILSMSGAGEGREKAAENHDNPTGVFK